MATEPTSRRNRWAYVVPAVAVAAGLLFGVSANISRGTDLRPGTSSLVGVVGDANRKVKGQQRDVQSLQNEVTGLTKHSAPGSVSLQNVNKAAASLAPSVGTTKVSGKAVRVTLTDSTRSVDDLPEGGNVDWLVVHQQDVQAVVNAMWQSGATSMMLMDQRVISTSAVRCVGNTLILQGRVYSPPFTITAMGDIDKIKKGLDSNPDVQNYRAYVDLAGIGYQQETIQSTFPAYAGSLDLRYAKPEK